MFTAEDSGTYQPNQEKKMHFKIDDALGILSGSAVAFVYSPDRDTVNALIFAVVSGVGVWIVTSLIKFIVKKIVLVIRKKI